MVCIKADYPSIKIRKSSMKIKLHKIGGSLALLALGVVLSLNAQAFTILHNFGGSPDGANPGGVLLTNGIIFGTSYTGGSSNRGAVFSFSTNNGANYTILHDFTNQLDGQSPNDLVLGGAALYGTTQLGGTNGFGTIFKVGTNGLGYAVLRSFTNTPEGANPLAGLVLSGATLYGTTAFGGTNGYGTVFKINTNGSGFTVLHNFTNSPDGQNPHGKLVLNAATLYGVTQSGGNGGANIWGTIYKIGTNGGNYTILHNFTNSPDGALPEASLTFDNNVLYGTTELGGNGGAAGGTIGGGTVFRMTTNGGSFVILHNFSNFDGANFDGAHPQAELLINTNIIYGSATDGGSNGVGVLFQINTNGSGFSVLKTFTTTPDGANPDGGLAINGKTLYGMSSAGGSSSNGLAFSLILSPVITSQPQSLNITNGDPVSFTVAAEGAPPLSYQWYFKTNTIIVGATNAELDYATSTTNLAGAYRVVITNSYGSITSSFAILTVALAPVVPSIPVILNYNFNPTNGSFSLAVSNTASSTNRLWASTNLISTNFWKVIATNVQAANGLWFFTDTNTAKTNAARFYRFSTP
jgi:uncharacterized repeat protein (TIGR03803 family)